MKREFLEELGLEKPLIDAIMSEHGKSVSALKERVKDIEDKDAVISALTAERDSLSASLTEVSEKHSAFKSGIVDGLIKEANPSSSFAEKELKRILSECDDGCIKETLGKIKEKNPDAFTQAAVSVPYFSSFDSPSAMPYAFGYRKVR